MKRRYIIFFSFVLVILVVKQGTCHARTISNNIISVDVNSIEDHNLSDIAESIKLIPLMTSETDVQIPDVGYAYMNDKILLLKSLHSQNFFLFDLVGNCLADFCQIMGHDKIRFNDYGRICKLAHYSSIDNKNKVVYLFDGGGKVFAFSYSGELLDTMNVPISNVSDIMKLKKGFAYISSTSPFYLFDDPLRIKHSNLLAIFQDNNVKLEMSKPENIYPFTGLYISELKKEYLFHTYANDTLFSVNKKNGSVNAKYIIDFGIKSYPKKLADMPYNQFIQYMRDNEGCAGYVRDVFANDKYVMFSYTYQGYTEDFIYSIKTNYALNGKIENDIFIDGNVSLVGATVNSFIFVINDPWHMKLSENGKTLMSDEDYKFISSINENTDYILFEVKLKPF